MALDQTLTIGQLLDLGSDIQSDWERWHAHYRGMKQRRAAEESSFTSRPLAEIRGQYEVYDHSGSSVVHAIDYGLSRLFHGEFEGALRCMDAPLERGNMQRFREMLVKQQETLSVAMRLEIDQEEHARGFEKLILAVKKPRTFDWWQIGLSILALVSAVGFGVAGILVAVT